MTKLETTLLLLLLSVLMAGVTHAQDEKESTDKKKGFLLEDAGFATPESVLHDPLHDTYLVSNINGSPSSKDGNGFISRVSPEGKVLTLKWIDGKTAGVTLNAPKGMALHEETLAVADIDAVRLFDRKSGKPKGDIVVEGAVFLNDVAAASNGMLYVTDSGGGAIYRIDPRKSVEKIAQGEKLRGPNGIKVKGDRIHVAGFAGKLIYRLDRDHNPTDFRELPEAGLDGLVLLDDGSLLVSSWRGSAIYHLPPSGEAIAVFTDLTAPADIGYDAKRGYVLIPHFQDHKVEARPLKKK